eukprot:453033_1
MAGTYHGLHEYSTFSTSTISASKSGQNYDLCGESHDKGLFHLCCCFLCRLSSSLVLHPVGPFRCIWDIIVMILLIYTSIEIPYSISFGTTSTTSYIGLAVDILLFFDIFLNFHTAYFDKYDNLRLVINKRYICKKYFRSWFVIDFITCIPFEFIFREDIAVAHDDDDNNAFVYIKVLRVFRLLRIIKILRFLKMLRIFDAFMKQFIVREVIVVMKLCKVVFGMLMFAHFAACLWWFVGDHTSPSWIDDQELRIDGLLVSKYDTWERYSFAWYWAVVTLFTTGYGDIVATNMIEQWVSSICILIGTCFFAYFVGTLTVLITEGDKIKSFELEKLEEAQSFCERKKLPKELTRAILTHIRYHCTYNFIFDESELLNILPAYLQHDIHSYISKQFLLKLNIFKNDLIQLPDFIIGLIAVKTKSISCNQHYKLYDYGDFAKTFYIQRTGKSILYNKHDQQLCELKRGSVCGEYSSFLFKKRKLKVECQTWSEFYSINIDDIKRILDEYYPKTALLKWNKLKQYLKKSYKDNVKHCVDLNAPHDNDVMYRQHGYQESDVHLFDNTRDSNKKGTPTPAASQNDAGDIVIVTTDDLKNDNPTTSTPKSPNTPSNPLAKASISYITDEALKPKKQYISASRRSKFAKFRVKGNSELRNAVIVAHSEKHKKLTTPRTRGNSRLAPATQGPIGMASTVRLPERKSAPQLRRTRTAPANVKSPKSLEMMLVATTSPPKDGVWNGSEGEVDMMDHQDDDETCRYGYSTVSGDDSECSYHSMDNERNRGLVQQDSLARNPKMQKKTSATKRKKGKGKFAGRTGGKTGGSKAQHRTRSSVIDRGGSLRSQKEKTEIILKMPEKIPTMNKNYEISLVKSTAKEKEESLVEPIPTVNVNMNDMENGNDDMDSSGSVTPFSDEYPDIDKQNSIKL